MSRANLLTGGNTLVVLSLVQVLLTSNLVRMQCVDLAKKIDRYSWVVFPLALAVVMGLLLNGGTIGRRAGYCGP